MHFHKLSTSNGRKHRAHNPQYRYSGRVSAVRDERAAEKHLTDEIKEAIRVRSADLGRALISERTGLDLTDLSPAEKEIVQAVSEYVGVMKRQGKDATRTLLQLRKRGLIEAAETAVAKSTCQRRRKNASVFRSKNPSVKLATRARNLGPFLHASGLGRIIGRGVGTGAA